jgi:8-oxo-dGTP pyrophosphatase MutT (NUDIX family)
MRKFWVLIGTVVFWVSWPVLWVYLRIGARTRVLIMADNEVLVVKPFLGTGQWGLPGGGLHKGEDTVMGAIREVREETGINLKPAQLQAMHQARASHRGLKFKYFSFKVELNQKPSVKHQPVELLNIAWKPLNELTTQTVSEEVTDIINYYNSL